MPPARYCLPAIARRRHIDEAASCRQRHRLMPIRHTLHAPHVHLPFHAKQNSLPLEIVRAVQCKANAGAHVCSNVVTAQARNRGQQVARHATLTPLIRPRLRRPHYFH